MAEIEKPDTPTNVVDDLSPVLKGREGLPITAEEDRMLEIKWAEYWNENGQGWGQQVHGTYTAEVVDGFYQFRADNPDIPNWWFPRDFMDGQQLTQKTFIGWGTTQKELDDIKEAFEKGIFDKEEDKGLFELVNKLDGSDSLLPQQVRESTDDYRVEQGLSRLDTSTNVVDDYITALKQEASKYKTFDEYEKAFSREYKRGIYYHLTDNPNFVVDLSKGATDAATGKMKPGSIMFTTDLDYWADTTWTDRPYVAILDLSDVDESQFTQVNRGQGNEFYLDDAFNVKVKEVIPVDQALKQSELINQWGLDNLKNKEDLKKLIWNNRPDTPGGSLGAAKLNDPLVFDSWIDNYAKTTTSFIDNLPLSTTVKNQFDNLVRGRARNLATPGGVADAVDVWELGVLGLMVAAVAYKEYDEIPTILTNKAVDMFNNMTSFYGIPPVPKEQYDLDYEFINKVVETGEKFMPTDIIIKKVGEVIKGVGEKGLATGFGYVPTTPEKTDTMETKQKIQPGVQEEKMFERAKPKKVKPTGGAGAKIL